MQPISNMSLLFCDCGAEGLLTLLREVCAGPLDCFGLIAESARLTNKVLAYLTQAKACTESLVKCCKSVLLSG